MPRKKSKPVAEHIEQQAIAAAPPEAFVSGDAYEAPLTTSVDATFSVPAATPHTDAAPESKPRTKAILGYHFGDDGSVVMTDTGRTLGIKFDLREGKPPTEVLDAVREDRTYGQTVKRGLSYDAREKQWVKRVSDNPVGDRLEVEARTKLAADRYVESKARQTEQGR